MQPKNLSAMGQKFFKLVEFDEDEELISEIRKHPIGLFAIYFTGFFVAAVLLLTMFLIAGLSSQDLFETGADFSRFRTLIIIIGFLLAGLTVLMTIIGGIIYRNNVVFITTEKIVQVLYRNIIDRKISQLNTGDVQDVTVRQDTIFSRIFNYGTIIVETAGEQQNYMFTFAPTPYKYAKDIITAQEISTERHGN